VSRGQDPTAIGGRRAVLEAIRSGLVQRVLVARTAHVTEGLRALTEAAAEAGVVVERVDPAAIEGLGLVDHQGVAAFVTPPRELDERSLSTLGFDSDALVVVLDGVTDPQNFGACARSAEAAGATLLVTRKRRAAPLTAASVRSSAGALLHLPVARVANITRALGTLKDRGFFVAGLDHRGEKGIHDGKPPPRPLALVVGAEDVGLSRLVREACDVLVSIPMRGRMASLNAAAALSVGLFGYALRPPAG
jgi:23S rRNA (guanosine2251-2'-O)-methyltransferase